MCNPENGYRRAAAGIKKSFVIICLILPFFLPGPSLADELADLCSEVEKLNISRDEYTLCKVLTEEQKKKATRNPVTNPSPGTYKFKDENLFVVAHESSDRVLIIYEQYDPASRKKVRDLTGALFLDFGEPTVMAHKKIVYWAYGKKGKISKDEYKREKKKGKLTPILATVKLSSSEPILKKDAGVGDGSVYYVISSEPVLKLIGAVED